MTSAYIKIAHGVVQPALSLVRVVLILLTAMNTMLGSHTDDFGVVHHLGTAVMECGLDMYVIDSGCRSC